MNDPASQFLLRLCGRFLVFDGPDGSGKSTQIRRFLQYVEEKSAVKVCHVREPGGTEIGEKIRQILLDTAHQEMDMRCEMLLYMASRAQLITQRIAPALAQGQLVLADRFISSTLAYQGAAGGLPIEDIRHVGKIAVGRYWPDLVVVFDVDEETAASRLSPLLDRIEQRGRDYHRTVRQGYLAQAQADPKGYLVVDASRDPDQVFAALCQGLAQKTAAW